jgi:hypothetical protein
MKLEEVKAEAGTVCLLCRKPIPAGDTCHRTTPVHVGFGGGSTPEEVAARNPAYTFVFCSACFQEAYRG